MSQQKPSSLNKSAGALLSALINKHRLSDPPPGAMTITEFARKIGRSPHTAKAILEKNKLRKGEFKGGNGKAVVYYW